MLNKLVSNPILEPYFSPKYTIYNEQELLGAEKQLLRPDRLVIDNKKMLLLSITKQERTIQNTQFN